MHVLQYRLYRIVYIQKPFVQNKNKFWETGERKGRGVCVCVLAGVLYVTFYDRDMLFCSCNSIAHRSYSHSELLLCVQPYLLPLLMKTELGGDRSNSWGRYQCVCTVRLQESARQPVRTAAVNFAALSFDIQPLVFSCCDRNWCCVGVCADVSSHAVHQSVFHP